MCVCGEVMYREREDVDKEESVTPVSPFPPLRPVSSQLSQSSIYNSASASRKLRSLPRILGVAILRLP